MITTVIFDLDGLVSDTEKIHRQAYRKVLGGVGVEIADREYEEHWIRKGKGIGEFMADHGIKGDPAEMRDRKARLYRELVASSAEAMPGAIELLERLRGRKKLALASSSYADAVNAVVQKLGIAGYFGAIVTRDDVERVKPWPDLFLLAAQRLGEPPGACLVIEDSERGVLAAYEAGMACIAVPNCHTEWHDFSKAGIVLRSLLDATPAITDGVFGPA